MEFRRFVERTLRMEAPAHVLLKICWVNCEQIETFENAYKKWLIQKSKTPTENEHLSEALEELIDSLSDLRSVYPTASLHSCDEEDTLQNAVIVGHTILGNA